MGLVPIAVVIGIVLRIPGLFSRLWYDELFTAWLAALPIDRMLAATAGDVHPAGYYLLVMGWAQMAGFSDPRLRLPSLCAGIALIYLINRLARVIPLTDRAVTTATALTALSPFMIYYSNELRSYILVMCAIVIAALGVLEKRPLYLISGAVGALYLNTMTVFPLATLGWWSVYTHWRSRWVWASWIVIAILWFPQVGMILSQVGQMGSGYWIAPPGIGRIPFTLDQLLFFMPKNPFILTTGLLTAVTILLAMQDKTQPKFPAVMVILPLSLAAAVSVLWTSVLFHRSMAGIAPFWYLIVARIMDRQRWLALAIWLTIAVMNIYVLIAPPWRNQQDIIPVPAGYSLFHTTPATYLFQAWYNPTTTHTLLDNNSRLDQSVLTAGTLQAMGIKRGTVDTLNKGQWYALLCLSPQEGIEESIAQIKATYTPSIISGVDGFCAVYKLNPPRNEQSPKK